MLIPIDLQIINTENVDKVLYSYAAMSHSLLVTQKVYDFLHRNSIFTFTILCGIQGKVKIEKIY